MIGVFPRVALYGSRFETDTNGNAPNQLGFDTKKHVRSGRWAFGDWDLDVRIVFVV